MATVLALLKAKLCALSGPREPERASREFTYKPRYKGIMARKVQGGWRHVGPGAAHLSADGSQSGALSSAAAAPLG